MKERILLVISIIICALHSGAQILNTEYVALADSADHYINHKQWKEAERCITQALRLEPANKSNYLLWSNLGMVRCSDDRFEEGIEAYSIGLASAPKSTVLLTNRASALFYKGRLQDALTDLDNALRIDSTLNQARKMRGLTLATIGRREEARRDLDICKAKNPEDVTILEALAEIEIGDKNYETALQLLDKSYSLQPDVHTAETLFTIADACGRLSDYSGELTKASEKYPNSATLHLLRAALYQQMYMTEEAEREIKKAKNCR